MAGSRGVRLEGGKELEKALKRLGGATRRAVLERALKDGGEVIAEEARRLVPVRSGTLKASIAVGTDAKDFNFASLVQSKDGATVYVGPQQGERPDGFYGHMVEFGTSDTPSQPFMRPAFDTRSDAATKIVGDRIADELAKLASE